MSTAKVKWSDLKVGLLSLLALLVLVTIVLKVGTNEKLFASKYQLSFFVPNVLNLSEGALVSLSGIKVGTVKGLELSQFEGENGVIVHLEIDKAYKKKITGSSRAHILTLGILGDKYVDITQGDPEEEPLKDGDFLVGVMPLDLGDLSDQAAMTLEHLNDILITGKSITQKIDAGEGFLGMLLNDPKFRTHMAQTMRSTSDLLAALKSGEGSFGLFLSDSSVYNNLSSMTRNLDGVSETLLAAEGSLGKLIADPALYANLESFSARADSLVHKLSNKGTTGRFFSDEQIYKEISQLLTDMQSLMQDVKTHPRKYLNLKVF
ncbi:MCE family protein [candidate division KSB1 bacterium]|nr:MCE family protein [candidate division KSB1 bacterium]NIR73148.1 MCE family protein [candidate division KSB1 bacterium]NIS23851.1 MCE family protein [candidate division KSB1 bacterium]NIT70772.1 MCE family protein [candidate division KSB1 bacterium]NIU24500.1 MCE family protein [candidate division KSB1 bacterium]